jgi:uncharacterized membrane protein YciS (DUF1049 family)
MFETLTVEQAIRRGIWVVNLPQFAILFGCLGIAIYLATQNYISGIDIAVVFVLGFILSWLYWSIMITRWRIWAFTNVRNVHELQKKAIEAKLINKDGGFFEKTEIRTATQKRQWAELQEKFKAQDIYQEDYSIPAETMIRYSRGAISISLVVAVMVVGGGIYMIVLKSYYMAIFLVGIGSYMSYAELKKVMDKLPQIILNDKGIETKNSGFTAWEDITDDQVITRTEGRSSNTYFEYNCPHGNVQLNIAELDTNKKALENMLHTYRLRNRKNNKPVRHTVID